MGDEPTRSNPKDVVQNICRSPNIFYYGSRILQTQTNQLCDDVSFPVAEYRPDSAVYTKTLSGTASSSLSGHHSLEYFSYPCQDSSLVKRWGFELHSFF